MAAVYFTVQLWLHILIHYIRSPETDQNMLYLSPYHRPVPNSAKFRENIEILWQQSNAVARLKILRSSENCLPIHRYKNDNTRTNYELLSVNAT